MTEQEKKNRAVDLRLKNTYGPSHGLGWYNEQLKRQDGGCAICGRKPKNFRLAVDHDHRLEMMPLELQSYMNQGDKWWIATAFRGVSGKEITSSDKKKTIAIAAVRKVLKERSVRALLCMICNRKVLGSIERFRIVPQRVIDYLKKYNPDNPLIAVNVQTGKP